LTASKGFFSQLKCADRPRVPPSLLFNGQQCFLKKKVRGLKLNPHIHLAPRLRNNRTIVLFSFYTFMTWTGKSLTFLLLCLRLYLGLPCSPLSKVLQHSACNGKKLLGSPNASFVRPPIFGCNLRFFNIKVKAQQSRYRPGVAQKVPGI